MDKLRKQIYVERHQLQRLIDEHRPLLESSASNQPSTIELSALATFLHSFYSGLENSLKRIAVEIDGGLPSGDAWHQQLLSTMTGRTDSRPPVLSQALHETLREYLAFRHFFRQAYSFHFDWFKMSHLVINAEQTLRRFEEEVDTFVDSISNY
ncbi:MAG TPA: hypothetical protein VFS76_14950 [Pyrinomonadaceae bacterium]|nr:hypothetical protein [Pyrinomonadaceae bacterium]